MACISTKSDVFVLNWSIQNFLNNKAIPGEFLLSPPFILDDVYNTKWHIKLYPKGAVEGTYEYITYVLSRADSDDGPECVTIEADGGTVRTNGKIRQNLPPETYSFQKGETCRDYCTISKEERQRFLKESDTFTIFFRIRKEGVIPSHGTEYAARTTIDVEKFEFKWCFDIQNNNTLSVKSFEKLDSSKGGFWYPHVPKHAQNPTFLSFEILPCTDDVAEISVCKIYLVDFNGKETLFAVSDLRKDAFRISKSWKFDSGFEWEDVVKERDYYFQNDILAMRGELITSKGHVGCNVIESVQSGCNLDLEIED